MTRNIVLDDLCYSIFLINKYLLLHGYCDEGLFTLSRILKMKIEWVEVSGEGSLLLYWNRTRES
jgi:hypothetical protein